MAFLDDILKKIKQNTLDKTDIDEKILGGVKNVATTVSPALSRPVQTVSKPINYSPVRNAPVPYPVPTPAYKRPIQSPQVDFKKSMQNVYERIMNIKVPTRAIPFAGESIARIQEGSDPNQFGKATFTPRSAAKFVKSATIEPIGQVGGAAGLQLTGREELKPEEMTGAQKFLMGDNGVKSFSRQTRDLNEFLKKPSILGKDLPGAPKPIRDIVAPLGIGAFAIASILPFGGAGKGIAQGSLKEITLLAKNAKTVEEFGVALSKSKTLLTTSQKLIKDSKVPINSIDDLYKAARGKVPKTIDEITGAKKTTEGFKLTPNLKLTDAYPKDFLGYNLPNLEKQANTKGFNLYDALIKRVDSQDNILDKLKGMESIMDDLYGKTKSTGTISKSIIPQDQVIKPQLDLIIKKAEKYQPEFQKSLDEIALSGGVKASHAPVKKLDRAVEKVVAEKGGDITQLQDINRGMIPIDKPEDVNKFMDSLRAKFGEPTSIKDSFVPDSKGYKKIIVNVKTPAGHEAEIQFTTPEMWKAKMELGGDAMYYKYRTLLAENIPSNIKALDSLEAKMNKLYTEADLAATKRLNSSSVISLPSSKALTGGKAIPSEVTDVKLPSELGLESNLTKVPSTSKNLGKVINKPPFKESVSQTPVNVKRIEDILAKKPYTQGGRVSKTTVEQVFKTKKFNLPPDQEKTLQKLQQTLGLGTRGTRSFESIDELAAALGTNPAKIIQNIQTGRITDSEVVALGDIINSSSQRITQLSKSLKAHPNDPDLLRKLSTEESLITEAIKKRIKGGTEAGRAVVAYRILANKTMEPAYWLSKAQRQIGDVRAIKPDEIAAINDFIKKSDRLGLARFVAGLGESTLREKMTGLWKAGLLTGFRTHEANIISNTAMQGLETVKDLPATVFDIARSAITGGERTKSVSLDTILSQGKAIPKGFRSAKEVITEGSTAKDLLKADISKPLRFGESKLGRVAQLYTDVVFRTLGAEDKVFKEMAFARSIGEQARVAGINRKLSPEGIKDLILNPTKEMLQQATRDSEIATFTNPNALAEGIRRMKGSSSAVAAVTDIMAPFVKTPTNVAGMVINYSPIGFPIKLAQKLAKGDQIGNKEIAEAFGRSVTGTGILALGYALAQNGKISGASPAGEAMRNEKNLEGQTSNSILINGKWRSLSRISPIGNLLLLGAAAHDAGFDLSKVDTYLSGGLQTGVAGAKSLSEQTFLKGVSGALAAVNDPSKGAEKYFNSLIASNIPTLISDIAKGTDDFVRAPEGVVENVKQRIPGIREEVPTRLTQLGESTKNDAGLIGSLFDPFNSRSANKDPLVQEFKRVGYNLNFVGETIGKVSLNRDQQRAYQKLAGEYIRQTLPDIINSSDYQAQDVDTQNDIIDKAVKSAKTQARNEIKNKLDQITSDSGSQASAAELTDKPVADKPVIKYSKDAYVTSSDAPKNLIDKFVLAARGIGTDPENTIKAIFTDERLRKISGNAVILERKNDLNQLDNKNLRVDHIVPLSIGGDNSPSNLQVMEQSIKNNKDTLEKKLARQLQAGEITKLDAQKQIKEFSAKNPVGVPLTKFDSTKQKELLATSNLTTDITTKKDNLTTGVTKFSYTTKGGKIKNIDLTPFTKEETGLDKIKQDTDKAKIALEIFKTNKSQSEKETAYKTLGYEAEDVRYADLSKLKTDEKTAYIKDKNLDHQTLIERLVTGRRKSIAGSLFVTDAVLTALKDEGLISDAELKSLKKIKMDSKGNSTGSSGSGSKSVKAAYKKEVAARKKLSNILSKRSSVSVLNKNNPFKTLGKSKNNRIEDILKKKRKLTPISQLDERKKVI